MSKPREFAHLIKNKFGSADNINSLGKSSFYTGKLESHYHTLNGNMLFDFPSPHLYRTIFFFGQNIKKGL
jgi:hypothetical protein